MGKAVVSQVAFQFRNNDGDVDSATFMGIENSDQTIQTGTANKFRLRAAAEETAGGLGTPEATLYYSHNSGTYTAVTSSSSVVQAIDEGQGIADDATMLSSYLYSVGSYIAGRYDDDGAATTAVSITSNYTEFEFSLYIVDADVSDGDTIDFEVYDITTALDSYPEIPRATVSKVSTRIPRHGFTNFQIPGIV